MTSIGTGLLAAVRPGTRLPVTTTSVCGSPVWPSCAIVWVPVPADWAMTGAAIASADAVSDSVARVAKRMVSFP